MSGKGNNIYIWEGIGITGGDALKKSNTQFSGIPVGTVGFNQNGIPAANVYLWNGAAWIYTTQTVAGFFGV